MHTLFGTSLRIALTNLFLLLQLQRICSASRFKIHYTVGKQGTKHSTTVPALCCCCCTLPPKNNISKRNAVIMKSVLFSLLSAVAVSMVVSDCSVPDSSKIDCGYVGITQSECQASGCCWAQASNSEIPWCFKQAGSGNCFGYQVRLTSLCLFDFFVSC